MIEGPQKPEGPPDSNASFLRCALLLFVRVPKARLELARAGARQILSLLRLPIPPLGLATQT